MKQRIWIGLSVLLVLALVLGLALAGCGKGDTTTSGQPATTVSSVVGGGTTESSAPVTTSGEPAKPLRVGVVLQLSDWYSVVDAGEEGDTQIVADIINEAGGITVGGQKYTIELVVEDGKSSLDGNTAAATKLALDEGVKFVVGPSAFFNVATSPIFEQNEILHVAGYTSMQPGEFGADTPWEFLGFLDPIAQMSIGFQAIQKVYPDVKKIALVSADDSPVPYITPPIMKMAEGLGFTFVGDLTKFANNLDDFTPIAAKLNAITDADAYFVTIGSPVAEANIVKALRTMGNDKPFVFSAYAPSVLAIAGADGCKNVLNFMNYTPNLPTNSPILDEIYARGAQDRQWFGMAPNALYMLIEVIKAADSVDPAVVKAKWETMDKVPTVYGDGISCGEATFGLKNHVVAFPMPSATFENGKIVDLGEWIQPLLTP